MAAKKRCPKCDKNRLLKFFATRGNGKPTSYCVDCQRINSRKHYLANRDEHLRRRYVNQKRRRKEIKEWVDSIKEGQPCVDCGESHPPWAMDYHHRDPSKKEFSIGAADGRQVSQARLEAEIAKCDFVCALCHRYRTHGRRRTPRGEGER